MNRSSINSVASDDEYATDASSSSLPLMGSNQYSIPPGLIGSVSSSTGSTAGSTASFGSGSASSLPSPAGSPLSSLSSSRLPFVPGTDDPLKYRMRYYDKLASTQRVEQRASLIVPAHIVPRELLMPVLHFSQTYASKRSLAAGAAGGATAGEADDEPPRTSSLTLIFSIWNTMMGSSLLALPWGFSESGFATGLAIVFLLGIMSCYTCLLILVHGRGTDDLFYVCQRHLGLTGKYVCWAAGVLLLVGSTLAYDILMSGILDSLVSAIFAVIGTSPTSPWISWWNSYWAAALVFLFVFPIANLKSFGLLVKFNTLGVISVFYTVGFLVVYCVFFEHLTWTHVPQFEPDFFVFAGMLSVSYFMHSLILPMMKHAEKPENNLRDVTIGYVLVGICYTIIGLVGYLAYWPSYLVPGSFPQEFLEVFSDTNIGALIARLALLFQLATVYPLLLLIIRIQFFGLLWGSSYPGWIHVFLLNAAIVLTATMFACFYPQFGSILRYLSICRSLFDSIRFDSINSID